MATPKELLVEYKTLISQKEVLKSEMLALENTFISNSKTKRQQMLDLDLLIALKRVEVDTEVEK